MKKFMLVFTVLILLTVTGCSNSDGNQHSFVFKGENEDWTVIYEVDVYETSYEKDGMTFYENESKKTLTATYKKDVSDFASNNNIEISYTSPLGEGKLTEVIDKKNPKKTYSMKSASTNGSLVNGDEVIEVTINIDGNKQTIELIHK